MEMENKDLNLSAWKIVVGNLFWKESFALTCLWLNVLLISTLKEILQKMSKNENCANFHSTRFTSSFFISLSTTWHHGSNSQFWLIAIWLKYYTYICKFPQKSTECKLLMLFVLFFFFDYIWKFYNKTYLMLWFYVSSSFFYCLLHVDGKNICWMYIHLISWDYNLQFKYLK